MSARFAAAVLAGTLATAGGAWAEDAPASDRLELESTSIRGNQELPRVMSIVPWKEPGLVDVGGKPVNSLVDEVLAPVDREVFLRQVRYFDQLYTVPGSAPDDAR